MAKKKTTVQELQELIEATPKAKILTDKQFEMLEKVYSMISDVRRELRDLEGEESISTIMFKVGSTYNSIDWCEDELRDIVDSFEEDCNECDENY